ncbi:hypothetical protein P3L10_020227 [Capsicum annuum]|uniref:uncharacterized protein LOC124900001 n=1 Tax=Capsicum annuum TaxID=4072 RepID=UPI001FB19A58|nr:uncharacterized protein LOC124900001 [Capsicum annuum]
MNPAEEEIAKQAETEIEKSRKFISEIPPDLTKSRRNKKGGCSTWIWSEQSWYGCFPAVFAATVTNSDRRSFLVTISMGFRRETLWKWSNQRLFLSLSLSRSMRLQKRDSIPVLM